MATTQAQLQSVADVDAGSVGRLTGASASTLRHRSKFGSFADIWSRSATLEIAESSGQLAKHCAGSQTAYIAVEERGGAPISLQQLHLPSADMTCTYSLTVDRPCELQYGIKCFLRTHM